MSKAARKRKNIRAHSDPFILVCEKIIYCTMIIVVVLYFFFFWLGHISFSALFTTVDKSNLLID